MPIDKYLLTLPCEKVKELCDELKIELICNNGMITEVITKEV